MRARTFAAGNLPSTIGTGAYAFQVSAPTFNPAAGTYEGVTFVEVSSATPSVELRYTLDGSEPTIASQLYESDIQLSPPSTTTIKVKGYRSGWVTSTTSTATYTIEEICEGVCECAEALDPNDQEPDDEALNCLIAAGGTVTLSAGSPGYIIATGLVLNLDNVTIQGDGNGRPLLIAHPNLNAPMLRAGNYSDYTIRDLIFDGNRDNRQLLSTICVNNYDIRTGGYNLQVKGAGFTVTNIYSQNALCGSGMEVDGSGFTISYNHVLSNGYSVYEQPNVDGPWSDGITLAN